MHPSSAPHYTGPLSILAGGSTFSAGESTIQALLPDEEYLTPSGRTYDIAGIPPGVRVPTLTAEQFADGTDPAFRAALRPLLKSG